MDSNHRHQQSECCVLPTELSPNTAPATEIVDVSVSPAPKREGLWRRARDLNPRDPEGPACFRNRCDQPGSASPPMHMNPSGSAEAVRFELTEPLRTLRFSRPAPSTTRPHLREARLADGLGFEPREPIAGSDGLASRCLRPLGHPSRTTTTKPPLDISGGGFVVARNRPDQSVHA